MNSGLWSFAHSVFQQSQLQLSVQQWSQSAAHQQSEEDIPVVWTEQDCVLVLQISPPANYPDGNDKFFGLWRSVVAFLKLQLSVKFEEQLILFKCKLSGSDLKFESDSKSAWISASVFLHVDVKYWNSILGIEVVLELAVPQELPFNHKLVSDLHERQIRVMLDVNRHSPPAAPSQRFERKINLIYPLQISFSAHEISSKASVVSLVLKNNDQSTALKVVDISHQLSLCKYDFERIIEMSPTSAEDSFDLVSITEDATTMSTMNALPATTPTPTNRPSLNDLLKLTNICHEDSFILQPQESKVLAYQIYASDEIIRNWQKGVNLSPFAHFRYPISLLWQPQVSGTDLQAKSITLRSSINFSLSTKFFSHLSTNAVLDMSRQLLSQASLSPHPKTFHNNFMPQALLNVDFNLPRCVKKGEEFIVKLALENSGSAPLFSCALSTDPISDEPE